MKSKSIKKIAILTTGLYKTVKRKKVQILHIVSSIDGGENIAVGYLFKGKKASPMIWKLNGKHMKNKKLNIKKRCG
jgi:hypothetical protein